ncbi:MAG: biotin-dependent carboxyltransferase [Anaerolineaceae bacterium]|nr:biotin-dependent carboxyltransferase [Anaerolineaceae bacterium]
MTLLIEQAALMMTVQDLGRFQYQRFGLPESGPMDNWAHRAANRLAGNSPEAACLEIGFSSAFFQAEANTLLAVTGAGFRLTLNNRPLPLWMSFQVKMGDRIALEKMAGGDWAYLAVAGGLQTPSWLGSRSTYARGGLGAPLMAGERVMVGFPESKDDALAVRSLPANCRPRYQEDAIMLRVVPGPHQHRFTEEALTTFTGNPYFLSTRSDRMGYRLNGPALAHRKGADLVSQGMTLGEIQVPGDGQPIVMMPDHPTTGGYTCIGTVIRADLPLLAQAQPERTEIRFEWTDVETAQILYRRMINNIDGGIQTEEMEWLYL